MVVQGFDSLAGAHAGELLADVNQYKMKSTNSFVFKRDSEAESLYQIYFNGWHFCTFDASDGCFTFTVKDQSVTFSLIEELTDKAAEIQEGYRVENGLPV